MKLKLILILSLWSLMEVSGHGGHMATFKYEISANEILFEFQIENSILEHFEFEEECENYEAATAMCLFEYINKNSKIKLDHQTLVFELQNSQRNENFLSLKMSVRGNFSNYKNLTVENECFLEFDREFENRIIIQKEDSLKSYRLNIKHQKITI